LVVVGPGPCSFLKTTVIKPGGVLGGREGLVDGAVIIQWAGLIHLNAEALVVHRSLGLRPLAVDPEVPQFARDLRRRDAVGVVGDQSQQEDAVVTQVEVGEPPDVDLGRLLVHHRVHLVPVSRRLTAAGTQAGAATEVVAYEADSILRD